MCLCVCTIYTGYTVSTIILALELYYTQASICMNSGDVYTHTHTFSHCVWKCTEVITMPTKFKVEKHFGKWTRRECVCSVRAEDHLPQCVPRFCPIWVSRWDGPCCHRQVWAQSSALRSNSVSHTWDHTHTHFYSLLALLFVYIGETSTVMQPSDFSMLKRCQIALLSRSRASVHGCLVSMTLW